jgi:hypothetical protein
LAEAAAAAGASLLFLHCQCPLEVASGAPFGNERDMERPIRRFGQKC